MGSVNIRTLTWLAAMIGAVVFFGYLFFFQNSGPLAIRPTNVTDPILLPVILQYADGVDANPGQSQARMHLGMTYEGAGMNELAESTYMQFVELFPDKVIGWYRLAIVQQRQGEVKKAILSLERAVEFAGEKMDAPHWQLAFWYIDVGNLEGATKQASIANSKNPNSMQVQIANGRIALEEGNAELALEILNNNRLIEKVPDGYVYQLIGRAYRANGDEEKSREAWSRAGQKKPNWADPWTNLVVNHIVGLNAMRQEIMKHIRENEIEAARKLIDEYFTYEKDNRVVRRLDAACDSRQGKVGKALKKFGQLISEEPTDTVTMVLLAKLRMRIPQLQNPNELAVTREILTTVLEISPDNEQVKTLLGSIPKE